VNTVQQQAPPRAATKTMPTAVRRPLLLKECGTEWMSLCLWESCGIDSKVKVTSATS